MRVDIPEYKTFIDFPTGTPEEEIQRVISTHFPPKTAPLIGRREQEFQKWYKGWAIFMGINPDPDDPRHRYDYRAAYLAGAAPAFQPEHNQYRWPDAYSLIPEKRAAGTPKSPPFGERVLTSAKKAAEDVLGAGEFVGRVVAGGAGFILGIPYAGLREFYETAKQGYISPDWLANMRKHHLEFVGLATGEPYYGTAKAGLGAVGAAFDYLHSGVDKWLDRFKVENENVRAGAHIAFDLAMYKGIPTLQDAVKQGASKIKLSKAREAFEKGDMETGASLVDEVMLDEPAATKTASDAINAEFLGRTKARFRGKGRDTPVETIEPTRPLRTAAERQVEIERLMPTPLEETLAKRARWVQREIETYFPRTTVDETLAAEKTELVEKATALDPISFSKVLESAEATHRMARSDIESLYRDYMVLREANLKAADLLEKRRREAEPWIAERERTAAEMRRMQEAEDIEAERRRIEESRRQGREYATFLAEEMEEPPAEPRPPVEPAPPEPTPAEAVVPPEPPGPTRPSIVDGARLIAEAKKRGISVRGKTWEQVATDIEATRAAEVKKPPTKPVVEPTPAQAVSTSVRDSAVLDFLEKEHGKTKAAEIFDRLTDAAKDRIYNEEVATYVREKIPEERVVEPTLDDVIEAEESEGREIGLAEERPISSPRIREHGKTKAAGIFARLTGAFHSAMGSIASRSALGNLLSRSPTNMGDLVRFLAANELTHPYYKEIARLMLEDPDISMQLFNTPLNFQYKQGARSTSGAYWKERHLVEMEAANWTTWRDFAGNSIHEAVHALTVKALDDSPQLRREVISLLEAADERLTADEKAAIVRTQEIWRGSEGQALSDILLEQMRERGLDPHKLEIYYGLFDPYEFVSQTFNSETFQRFLAESSSIRRGKVVGNLLSVFRGLINKYIFKNRLEPSLLDDALDVSVRLMKHQAKMTPWGDEAITRPRESTIGSIVKRAQEDFQRRGLDWLDEELRNDIVKVGQYYRDGGFSKWADWSKKMKDEFGDDIADELPYFWAEIQNKKFIQGQLRRELSRFGNPDKIVQAKIKTVDGVEVPKVAISEAEMNQIASTVNDLERSKAVPWWMSAPIRDFEYIDAVNKTSWKTLLYDQTKRAESLVKQVELKIQRDLSKLRKKVGYRKADEAGLAAWSYGRQLAANNDVAGLNVLKRQVGKIPETLTPAQKAYYDYLRSQYEYMYQLINQAREMSGKEPIGYVEDYTTFARNIDKMIGDGVDPSTVTLKVINSYLHPETPPLKSAKPRVRGAREEFDLNLENTFMRTVRNVYTHVYKGPIIARVRALQNFKLPGGKVLRDLAPEFDNFLTGWADFQVGIKGPYLRLSPGMEAKLTRRLGKIGTSILSGSLRIAIVQPSAVALTLSHLGLKWTTAGIMGLLHPAEWRMAQEKSNVLSTRYNESAIYDTLADIAFRSGGKFDAAYSMIKEKGMLPLELLDHATATATWIGAYKKAIRIMDEESAVTFADDTVVKTQASVTASDVTPVQRTPLGRALAMFQSYAINEWNYLARDIFGIKNPRVHMKDTFKRLTRYMIATAMVNSFYQDILGTSSPMPTPIRSAVRAYDESDSTLNAMYQGAAELASYFPWLRSARYYGSSLYGAAADVYQDLAAMAGGQGISIYPLLHVATTYYGIPYANQILRAYRRSERGYGPVESVLGPIGKRPEKEKSLVESLISEGFPPEAEE
jgi:hypothetical protein